MGIGTGGREFSPLDRTPSQRRLEVPSPDGPTFRDLLDYHYLRLPIILEVVDLGTRDRAQSPHGQPELGRRH
jgi:hypothetical protein